MSPPATERLELAVRFGTRAGLDCAALRLLHDHATGVYLAPRANTVLRLSPAGDIGRLRTSLAITRWAASRGLPVTEPAALEQPLLDGATAATFWTYYPQLRRGVPPAEALGALLAHLHALGRPPVDPPAYRPLVSLLRILDNSTVLAPVDRAWLQQRATELLADFDGLTEWPLGPPGFIHGDAYPGNTLWDRSLVRLGDWDECATGPRELDLANVVHSQRRFLRPSREVDAFFSAYGRDVRA